MKSGRYIGVMSGTSLDGIDVVLAAIDDRMVAQQASYSHPMPMALKKEILGMCQGQQTTLAAVGRLARRCGTNRRVTRVSRCSSVITTASPR